MYKIAFAMLAGCLLCMAGIAQTDHIGKSTLPGHPRILLLKNKEADILQLVKADSSLRILHRVILDESELLLNAPPVERIQIGRRLLDKSREALRRLFFLGYAYRLTGDDKYAKRSEKEMLAIAAFSDWNPSHFLDVAEMTMALAIGYDWLYDWLSPAARTSIKEAIIEKGLKPSLESKYNHWLRVEHNWNQVCNAGMTYGALAVYEDEPQLAKTIINRSIDCVPFAMKDYAPDGAYPEGYGYWGYGTSFNVLFVQALEKALGKDFGISEQPGFVKTGGYLLNMTGPSGQPFNYSDAGTGGGLQPAMFWFASRAGESSWLWVEQKRLQSGNAGSFGKNRLLPLALLSCADAGIHSIPAPAATMWVGQGKNPVALMRSSWTDSNAVFVGMKGGSASVNHAHMDIGSFVMEAEGVRWAMDFGMQDYESLESRGIKLFGRTQDAERWNVFRYNNFVHNTLTINNQHQRVDGYAPIVAHGAAADFMFAITDLSTVYKGSVSKAVRGVALVDKRYLLVRDELVAAPGATVRWTLLTPAAVRITGSNTVELTARGKTCLLRVAAPASVQMKTWSTDPPHDYDAPNPGTSLVGFEATVPAGGKLDLQVVLVPDGGDVREVKGKLKDWK